MDGKVDLHFSDADKKLQLEFNQWPPLAVSTGDRKMELVLLKELLALTGYIRGGVTVAGAMKHFPSSPMNHSILGSHFCLRGTQIVLAPGRLSPGDGSCDRGYRLRKIGLAIPSLAKAWL